MKTIARILILLLGIALIPAIPVIAQTAQRYATPYTTAFDTTGVVSPGAKLNFYLTGSSTRANTYSNVGLTIANSNPVVADGSGLFGNIFMIPNQQYKVVLTDTNDNVIWTADPVQAGSLPSTVYVTNIAGLKALGSLAPNFLYVYVQGYTTAGDGGGGLFIWQPASTATTDICVTFQATGVTTGRYVRQVNNRIISLPMCGVKSDSATDNTTAIQAAFDATSTYGYSEVYCPASTGTINLASTVNVPTGVTLRGSNYSLSVVGQTGSGAACYFKYTGSGSAVFSTQTPLSSTCPNVQGPSFYDFSIDFNTQSTGYGIKLNDPATANYTDACSSISTGQSILQGGTIQRIAFHCDQRGTVGISLAKVFNYTIRDNISAFCDKPWQFDGSDNIDFQHNNVGLATSADLTLNGHGTFGNMFYAHNNTFNSPYINAPYFINSTYGQLILDSNYFESQNNGGSCALNLSGLDATVINNGMYIDPAIMPKWLCVSGVMEHLKLDNNWDGGLNAPAYFNSGAGYKYMYNGGGIQAVIVGANNPGSNSGIPFFTNYLTQGSGAYTSATPPSAAGALLARVSPASPNGASGTYGADVVVKSGCFVLPALSGTGSEIKFIVRPVVSDTVDIWIYAAADSGSTQLVSVSTDNGATYTTQALTTTLTWYKVISNVAVVDPVLGLKNSDLAHGSITANVCAVQYVKH